MSSGGGPTLMDVFVGVKPDPQFMQQIESNFGEARNKIRQMFEGIQTDAGQAAANAMVSRLQEINRLLQDMEARADRLRQDIGRTDGGGGGPRRRQRGGGGGGGGTGGGGTGGGGAGGGGAGEEPPDDLAQRLRVATDEFNRLRRATEPRLRLVGDDDLNRRLQNLVSNVQEAQAAFRLRDVPESQFFDRGEQQIERVIAATRRLRTGLRPALETRATEAGLLPADAANRADISRTVKQQFREIRQESGRLRNEFEGIAQAASRLGPQDIALKERLGVARSQFKVLQQELKDAIANGSLQGAQQARDNIRSFLSGNVQAVGSSPATPGSFIGGLGAEITGAASGRTQRQQALTGIGDLEAQFEELRSLGSKFAQLSSTSKLNIENIRLAFVDLRAEIERGIEVDPLRVGMLQTQISNLRGLVNQRMEALVNPADGVESAINRAQNLVNESQNKSKLKGAQVLSSLAGVSGEDRQTLLKIKTQLEEAIAEYKVARQSFFDAVDEASSIKAVARVRDTAAEVNTIASNASARMDEISQSRLRNFNALSNSAYQLGQAFEDAAIGYQLNGLAGALRGAANNISFVVNNLAQAPAIQDSIARRFGIAGALGRDLVGITTGIGAALAVTVLPPTVEWLESLNDIELELEDISERYSEIVGKTERQVKLSLETQQFTRGVARADNFRAVLDSLDDLREKAQDTRIEIAETVDGLANSGAFAILKTQFDSISKGIDTVIEKYRKQAEFLRQPSLMPLGAPDGLFSPDKVLRAQEKPLLQFRATRDAIVSQIETIQRSSRDFPVAPESFDNARKLLNKLQDDLKATIGREDFADFSGPAKDAAAQLEANLKPLDKTLEDLRNRAEEFRELTTRRLTEGIEAALRQTEVLQQRQLLIRERLSGREIPGGEMLLDVVEMSRAYQDLIDKQLKLYERAGMARQDIERVRASLQRQADLEVGNQSLEQQADILEQIRQAEERIAELQGRRRDARSQNINFDSQMTKLQENALSKTDDNTKALKDVRKELQNLNVRLVKLQASDLIRNQLSFLQGELGQTSEDPRIPGAAQQAARMREQINMTRQLEMFLPGFNPVVPGRGAFSMPVMAPGIGPTMGMTELVLRNTVLDGFSMLMQFMTQTEIGQKILGVQEAIKQKDERARVN